MIELNDYIQLTNAKPCPFCGDQPILEYVLTDWTGTKGWEVGCQNIYCMFQPRTDWDDPHEAVDMWNDRKTKKG